MYLSGKSYIKKARDFLFLSTLLIYEKQIKINWLDTKFYACVSNKITEVRLL